MIILLLHILLEEQRDLSLLSSICDLNLRGEEEDSSVGYPVLVFWYGSGYMISHFLVNPITDISAPPLILWLIYLCGMYCLGP